jgi:hypothetical protein
MKAIEVIVIEAGKKKGFIQSYSESPSLGDLQDLVGGNIEFISLNDSQYMVVNENGLNIELPYNIFANDILAKNRPEFAKLNAIVGDVFLIDKKDV